MSRIKFESSEVLATGYVALGAFALYMANGKRQLNKGNEQLRYEAQQLAQENEQLRYEVAHDELTGLLTKKPFLTRSNQRLAEARPDQVHAMLFIDLDNFKAVNDKHPDQHSEGDRVLQTVAGMLLNNTRQSEHLSDLLVHGKREDSEPARLGGDEFAIFAELAGRNSQGIAISPEERLEAFCNRIYTDLDSMLQHRPDLMAHGLGMSIGRILHLPGETAEDMLMRGDQVMQDIKGRHHVENGNYRN